MRKLAVHELGRPSAEVFAKSSKQPIVVVLDNVRSGMNVGSVFRTADAFAIDRIYLCGITPRPPHREILKTALGSTESVEWVYFETAKQAILELLDTGYTVWPVEQTDNNIGLQFFKLPSSPVAFVFGNEVNGVSDEVIAMLSASIEIPQFGTKHSLNVSVAAGIVLWHATYASGRHSV